MSFEPLVMALIAGFIGLAIVAVVVSKKAQTPAVLAGAGAALSAIISKAVNLPS
jgi:hypothetical protein